MSICFAWFFSLNLLYVILIEFLLKKQTNKQTTKSNPKNDLTQFPKTFSNRKKAFFWKSKTLYVLTVQEISKILGKTKGKLKLPLLEMLLTKVTSGQQAST